MIRNRIPQLDLLRGIAVLSVLLLHYPYFRVFEVGWAGVDLFFVLSGFLISGLLFTDWKQNRSISLSRFFIRRGFKIYPAFYFFLFTVTPGMIIAAAHIKHDIFRRMLAEVFFLQDYLPHIWLHTWSLAVEEQFYILLPLLLIAISKVLGRKTATPFAIIPSLSILLMIVCLGLRVTAVHHSSLFARQVAALEVRHDALFGDNAPLAPLHFRADGLFAGVMLGYLFHFRPIFFRDMSRWWLLPLSFLFLTPLFLVRTVPNFPYVLTCNTLAFASLVWWIIPRSRVRMLWIELIGTYSYSIYLWHVPFVWLFGALTRRFVWLLLYLAVATLFGAYMGKIIEMRALAARENYFPSKRPAFLPPSIEVTNTCAVEN